MNRRLFPLLIALAAAGVPAAFLWAWLAEPAKWVVSGNQLYLTESNANGQFNVVAVFVLIGVLVSFVFGVLIERLARPHRWPTAVSVALMAVVAALICWQLGMLLGPPAPGSVSGLQSGDKVEAQLVVDAVSAFLAWPLGAVLGFTLSFYLGSDGLAEASAESEQVLPL